ncbi:MAG: hypothetical protein WCO12_03000 [bacterium]
MFKIIEEFLKNPTHKQLIKYTGAISAISGVFLAIQSPAVSEAADSLAVVQFFWLTLLTAMLTSLFAYFVVFVFQKEKRFFSLYDAPVGVMSMFTGVLLVLVVLNLLNYMVNIYPKLLSTSVLMGVPVLIALAAIFLDIFLQKIKHKVAQIILFLADSLVIGVLSGFAILFLQIGVTKKIYPHWIYLTFLIASIGFFMLLFIISICKRKNPFKPYVPVQ